MHLDGDRRYTDKSSLYYKKAGLQAIVKYIPEYRQPSVIKKLKMLENLIHQIII